MRYEVCVVVVSFAAVAVGAACTEGMRSGRESGSSVALQSTVQANEVFLLLQGYVQAIPGRELVPGVSDDGARLAASTMAVIEGDGATVFVDPGFVTDRGLIFQALDAVDIEPKEVTHVFISHHHPDHTINAALFRNAVVVDFWATYHGDLWEDHGDYYDVADGITVVRTPGHTDEDASLAVDTPEGTVVFTHVWWNEALFPPIDPIAEDQAALDLSRQLVLNLADCIVPGHGATFPNPNDPQASCAMVTVADPDGGSDSDSSDSDSDSDSSDSDSSDSD